MRARGSVFLAPGGVATGPARRFVEGAGPIARTEPYADPWESTPDDTCTPIRSAVIFQRRSSEPSFWNFERFTGGRLFAIPATVKLEESPGRAGGLPGVVNSSTT